jgi:EmrB/QacA subfamily drug resistance transporter
MMKQATENFPYKWWALIGLSLLSFTAFLDFTIVAAALPFIQKSLNATVLQLQWVMNILPIIFCMSMIAVGRAGELFGKKLVFYIGFVLFAIGAIGAGNAQTIHSLIFFRAIQGFAVATVFIIGVALLPQAFPANEQTRAIGVFSAFNGVGLAIGPFLSGVLISLLSWRWVFWINIPLIIIGIIFCSFSLKPSTKTVVKTQMDWLGLVLLIIGLGSLIYGIINGAQTEWQFSTSWSFIIVGITSFILLLFVESKTAHPILDLSLFKNFQASLAMLVCISAGILTYTFMFFDALYLASMRQQSAFLVGLTLLTMPIVQVFISIFFTKLVNKFSVDNLLLLGLATAVVAGFCHTLFTPTISIFFVLLGLVFTGYTWGIANAGSIAAVSNAVPTEKIGSTIGTIFTFWNLSGSVFLALASTLFHERETAAMDYLLKKINMILTPEQHQQITLLLSDPDQAKSILQKFVGPEAHHLLQSFYTSFMNGFHWVAWSATFIMLLIFLVGWRLRYKS